MTPDRLYFHGTNERGAAADTKASSVDIPENVDAKSDIVRSNSLCSDRDIGDNRYPAYTKSTGLNIVGTGDITRPHVCGTVMWSGVCEHDSPAGDLKGDGSLEHRRILRHSNCDQATCPICYKSWARRGTNKAMERLYAARELYDFSYEPREVVWSPPQVQAVELFEKRGKVGLWDLFYKMREDNIDKLGFGGCAILHVYRINKTGKHHYAAYKESGGGLHMWDWIREYGYWDDYLYVSPHYHGFVYGSLPRADYYYEQSGWTYKVIQNTTKNHMINAVNYALSHAYLDKQLDDEGYYTKHDGQVLRWFGILSYNKLSYADGYPKKEQVEAQCECGGILYKWNCDDDGTPTELRHSWEEDADPVIETIATYKYVLSTMKNRSVSIWKVDDYG